MAVQNATDIARVDGAMNFIAQFENLGKTGSTGDAKLEPYADSAGFVTIGYGHNTGLQVDKTTFDKLSDADQKALLQEKLNKWANTNKDFADQHLNTETITDPNGNMKTVYTSLKSEETAWRVFRKDTLKAMGTIRSDFGAALAALSPEQHVALTSLYFNVGSSTKFPKLLKILKTGRICDAGVCRVATGEDIIREWGSKLNTMAPGVQGIVSSGGVYEEGLHDRRLVELELFKNGSALTRGGGPGGLVQEALRLPWTDASSGSLARQWNIRGTKTQWPTPGSSGWAGRGAFLSAHLSAQALATEWTNRLDSGTWTTKEGSLVGARTQRPDSAVDRPASLVPDTGGSPSRLPSELVSWEMGAAADRPPDRIYENLFPTGRAR